MNGANSEFVTLTNSSCKSDRITLASVLSRLRVEEQNAREKKNAGLNMFAKVVALLHSATLSLKPADCKDAPHDNKSKSLSGPATDHHCGSLKIIGDQSSVVLGSFTCLDQDTGIRLLDEATPVKRILQFSYPCNL